MHTLVILILGLFVNGTTGESVIVAGEAPSVIACANAINAARHPIADQDGTLWYLTDAQCAVQESE